MGYTNGLFLNNGANASTQPHSSFRFSLYIFFRVSYLFVCTHVYYYRKNDNAPQNLMTFQIVKVSQISCDDLFGGFKYWGWYLICGPDKYF